MDKIIDAYNRDKERFLTAIGLLGGLLIVGFINSFFLTWLVLGGFFLFAFYEAMNLFKVEDTNLYVYAVAIWIIAYFTTNPEGLVFIVFAIFAGILAYSKKMDKEHFLPFLYPTASFLFILALYNNQGMGGLFWMIVVVAATDTAAYYTGKSIGKTPFSPTSPNKTLEGVGGGVIAGTILGALVGASMVNIFLALFISFMASVASVFGDLFESYLKREAGVKDSGDILPGHGGILDRTDGYLFASIVMVVFL
ncbi:MAG: phosphatidate cytidylyltransferase [Campylobacterales bacterium]|nr:phosphatidate cytidylyltransferase [Campylobacterales bacterium]